MKSSIRSAAALALVATFAGACGGSKAPTTSATPTSAAKASASDASPLQVEAKDFTFAPASFSAPKGSKVTVTVNNSGKAPHTFTAASVSVDEQIAPGQTKTVTFTMPASGSVAFVCKFHESQGMKGTISEA